MEKGKDVVEFSIAKVTTEQFAIIDKSFDEKEPINLNTNLRFAIDREERLIAIFTLFKFEQKASPFLMVEVCCQFLINVESWGAFIKEEGKIVIPKEFMTHLGMITVGTARGVLHTKTEGTKFNEFVLPTINVNELIKEDVAFA